MLVSTGTDGAMAGDFEMGEFLFRAQKCDQCHLVDRAEHGIGPHLVGIFGREAGTVEGFEYSDAMRESGIVWDEESLDALIASTRTFIPGNNMIYHDLRDGRSRADIITFLRQATRVE
jgi:cytochrome c